MKIATYNIGNLFFRDKGLSDLSGRDQESMAKELDGLMSLTDRSTVQLERMRTLWKSIACEDQQWDLSDEFGDYEWYRFISDIKKKRGTFETQRLPKPQIRLSLAETWEKANAILAVDADILVLQEVENQKNLELFNQWFLKRAYDTVHTVPTTDSRSRHMAVLLKDGLVLEETKTFGGTPPRTETHFSHAAQLYRILDTKGGKYDLVNLHFYDAGKWKDEDNTSVTFLSKLSQQLKMELYGTALRMVLGTLNIPTYYGLLQRITKSLGLFKVNDLPGFEVKGNDTENNGYHRLGAIKKGSDLVQRDYLLVPEYSRYRVNATGLVAPGQLGRERNFSVGLSEVRRQRSILWVRI